MIMSIRRARLAFVSVVIAGLTAIGLATPAHSASWSDYDIPSSGILVPLNNGTTIQAISPTCASALLVHMKSGATVTINLDTSTYYYSSLGVTSCVTSLTPSFAMNDVDSFAWWTAKGDVPVMVMSPVHVTDFQAKPGNHTITLSWTTPEHARWVHLYQFLAWRSSSPNQKLSFATNAAATSFVLNVPVNADDWVVSIQPNDLWGNGISSTLNASANITPQAPARVSLIAGDNQVQLLVAPATPDDAVIHHYNVTLQPGNISFTMPGNATSTIVTSGISNNVRYQATVTATNAAGTSAPTDSNVVITRATPRPVSAVSAHAYGTVGARVSWSPTPGDITGYRVTSAATGQSISVDSSVTSVIFDNVIGSGLRSDTYQFAVSSVNDYLQSEPQGATANMLPDSPSAIWATGSLHGISAQWSAPTGLETDIVGYSIDLVNDAGNSVNHVETTGTDTSVTIGALETNAHFRLRVATRTVWGVGASILSNVAVAEDVPSAPSNALVRQASGSDAAVVVSLGRVDPRGCAISSWSVTIDGHSYATSAGTGQTTVTGLSYGVNYPVEIRATNCWGSSEPTVRTVTLVAPPEPVSDVRLSLVAYNFLDVTWTVPATTNATSFVVTLSNGKSVVVSAQTSHVVFTDVALGTTVTATVAARNSRQTGSGVDSLPLLLATAPNQVSNLSFTLDEVSKSATITWSAGSNSGLQPDGFSVTVDDQVPFTTLDTQFVLAGLVAGETHTVSVQELNALGASPANSVSLGLPDPVVQTPDSNGTVIVWAFAKNISNTTTFVIQQKIGNGNWKSIATVRSTARSFLVRKPVGKSTFRVMAKVGKKLVAVKSQARKAR